MVKIIDQLLPDVFYNRLLKILDDNAPFKTQTNRKIKFSRKPWITKGIQKAIKVSKTTGKEKEKRRIN